MWHEKVLICLKLKTVFEKKQKKRWRAACPCVIGWGAGSVPFKTTPVFIDKPEDVDKLVWNPACVNNLAVYLPKMAKDAKVGIVAKPCDIRSIVTLIQERQVKRENIFIIGLGCGGVVDAFNLDSEDFHLMEVKSLDWTGRRPERQRPRPALISSPGPTVCGRCARCVPSASPRYLT